MSKLEAQAKLDRILNYCRSHNRTVRVKDLLNKGIPMHDVRSAVTRHGAGFYPDEETYTIISFRQIRRLVERV